MSDSDFSGRFPRPVTARPRLGGPGGEIAGAEELADGLRAHAAGEVLAEPPRAAEAVAQLPEQGLVGDDLLHLELLELDPGAVEAVDGLLGVVVHVAAAGLDVV